MATNETKGPFTIAMEFVAECGEPREPGLCPECGVEVGVSADVAEIAAARRSALESFDAELQVLVGRFEELPKGSIVVSNDQFANAVSDAGIFEQIGEMAGIGNELSALDVNDRAVTGGQLRKKMARRVARVADLLKACEELAVFDPAGPAGELRTVAAESGRYGARLTQAFVAILVAETAPAARAAEAEMQALLGSFPFKGRIDELLAEMRGWMVPDFDAARLWSLGGRGATATRTDFSILAPSSAHSPMRRSRWQRWPAVGGATSPI